MNSNINNMNRKGGYGYGTAEGTFGAAEGTFGGDCNRNKLGQLLVANIAALLNKKSESESESESEKSVTTPVVKVSTHKTQLLAVASESSSRSRSAGVMDQVTAENVDTVDGLFASITSLIPSDHIFTIDIGISIQEIMDAARGLTLLLNIEEH